VVPRDCRLTRRNQLKRTGLPPIAWALAGLLGIAAFLLSLGQQDVNSNPEAHSYSPSGISAFCELLRRHGLQVVVDQQTRPRLGPNDIAVAFEMQPVDIAKTVGVSTPEGDFRDYFWKHISDGGTGILLPMQRDFFSASQIATDSSPLSISDSTTGETFKMSSSESEVSDFTEPDISDTNSSITLWASNRQAFLRAYRVNKGTALVIKDGIGITNRFIDKNDNAKAFSALFSVLAKPGKRIVFTEASFGNVHERGLLETVGPWANAAWQQLIFLGLVVVFTLGRRFGISDEPRNVQRGSRELMDALADTFRRARSTQAALETSWVRADADLRLILKLPKDATRSERDKLIPVDLQNALARLEAAKQMPFVPTDQALDLIKRAEYELDAFLGPHRTNHRRLAKLKA